MKKIYYYIGAAVLALGLASCTKEIVATENQNASAPKGYMTLVASIDDEDIVKASLDGNDQSGYKVVWNEGDEISLEGNIFTLAQGAGTKYGTFTGPAIGDGEYFAVFGENLDGDTSKLSTEQYYSPINELNIAPMTASVSVASGRPGTITFKNACGLLRLDLQGSGTVKEIKITTDQIQAGKIDFDSEGAAYIKNSGSQTVALQCGESGLTLSSEAKRLYFSMPKNDYTGVKIELIDFSGHTCVKTLKADKTLSVARAQIVPVSLSVSGLDNNNVPLTWDAAPGTRGILDGQECVVVDLGSSVGKVAVATKNVGATSETARGTYMTAFDAALAQSKESWGKGWYIPSLEEIQGFETFYNNAPRTINKTNKTVSVAVTPTSSLIFPFTGFYDVNNGYYVSQDDGVEIIGCHFCGRNGVALTPTIQEFHTCGLQGVSASPVSFSYYPYCTDKYTVRPFHKLPMTRNTPVGMKARLDGRDAAVVIINEGGVKKKVAIATKNEGVSSENFYYEKNNTKYLDCIDGFYTYAEAEARCNDGWYIPSWDEYEALYKTLPYTHPVDGFYTNINWRGPGYDVYCYSSKFKLTDNTYLYIPTAGYYGNGNSRGMRAYYWTRTTDEADNTKKFVIHLTNGEPASIAYSSQKISRALTEKSSVRLFHAMPR